MAKSISEQINSIIEKYVDECDDKINDISEEVGKDTVLDLKRTSPKRPGRGRHYANQWAYKKEKLPTGGTYVIVYNKKPTYRLTHLLEHGHAKVNGGRVAAIPHIAPAEQRAISEYLKKLEEEL